LASGPKDLFSDEIYTYSIPAGGASFVGFCDTLVVAAISDQSAGMVVGEEIFHDSIGWF
jgi:hypothetical protein